MPERYIARIFADPHVETIFHVHEIRDSDTTLMLHLYTRNEDNAILALQSLRKAIGVLLKDCKKGPKTLGSKRSAEYGHAGIVWPLNTLVSDQG